MRAVTPPRTRGRGQVPHTAPPRMCRRPEFGGLLEERHDQPPADTALVARGADSARQTERQRKTDERRRLDVVADRAFGLAEQLAAVDSSRVERAAEGALKSACTDQAALRVLRVHRDIHRDDLLFRFAALVAILAAAMLLFRSRPYEVVRNHHQDVLRRFVFGIDRAFGAPLLLFRARLLLAGACFCCVVAHRHAHGPIARADLG